MTDDNSFEWKGNKRSKRPQDVPPGGPGRLYGRRKGKPLTDRRQSLIDELLPAIEVPIPENFTAAQAAPALDLVTMFGPTIDQYWLEIGFGGGEHLADQARANPRTGIIGCEIFINGVASLLAHLDEGNMQNVRIFREDARLLLPQIPDGSLDKLFLLFPDPWPKSKHWRRRFVQQDNLDEVWRMLKPGGEFRVGTDDPGYQRWTMSQMVARNDFDWQAKGPSDWLVRPNDWPPSRYEQKAIKEGRTPCYFRFHKV